MYMKGSKKSGRYYTIWDSWFSMQTSGFDVQVPKEPGLYYIGSWDGLQSFEDAENDGISRGEGDGDLCRDLHRLEKRQIGTKA